MKPTQKSNVKLQLKKRAIINLSESNQLEIKGGIKLAAYTTSHGNCSGVLCCEPNTTHTWPTTNSTDTV
jgi:hypothetical protein